MSMGENSALMNAAWADVSAALLHLMSALRVRRLDLASESVLFSGSV